MNTLRRRAFLILLLAPAAAARPTATFTALPDLDGGAFSCSAQNISADGSTIVGSATDAAGYQAVRWRNNVVEPLGILSGHPAFSYATACSADGSVVVGGSGAFPNLEAYRWEGGTMTGLGGLSGYPNSSANGISRDGLVIAGWTFGGQFRAFRREAATGLNTPLVDFAGSTDDSAASGLSGDGHIAVGRGISPGSTYEACRWIDNGAPIAMGDLPNGRFWSECQATNNDGSISVGYANAGDTSTSDYGIATRWVGDGAPQPLGDLTGGTNNSYALAVSDDGNTIVGYANTNLGNEAFIWDPINGMRNLRTVLQSEYGIDLTGWILNAARGLTPTGSTIVGTGINPQGNTQAWVVRFTPPCPTDLNHDGATNTLDLTLLLGKFGQNVIAGSTGDINGDGQVNTLDLTQLLSKFGLPC